MDTETLYELINNNVGTTKQNPLPDHTNEKAWANAFGEFFLEKIHQIQKELDKLKYQLSRMAPAEARLMKLKVLSEDKVAKIIMNMKSKPMPTRHHTNTNH